MQRRKAMNLAGRFPQPQHHNAVTLSKSERRRGLFVSKRSRAAQRNLELPFLPPEDWYEPSEEAEGYRFVVQPPGEGFRHVLTPDDVSARLAELPQAFLRDLQVVQFSRMTRKKQCFPCYGMQWGPSLYLYPIEVGLVERYHSPPTPRQRTEARMYGGQWEQESATSWKLAWTEESIRDFYLNNILIHELGHLVDTRNTRSVERERFAEWFAVHYGYKTSRRPAPAGPAGRRRHHTRGRLRA